MDDSTADISELSGNTYPASPPDPGKQSCGATEERCMVPCDIATLTITDRTSGASLTCDRPRHQEPPPDDAPYRVKGRLGERDLVMELTSSYKGQYAEGDVAKEKPPVNLLVETSYVGSCSANQHPEIEIGPHDGTVQQYQQTSAEGEFRAKPAEGLIGGTAWFDAFWSLFTPNNVIDIDGLSCGVRDEGNVNDTLNAQVVIYPQDEYELHINTPAYKSKSYAKSKKYTDEGTTTTTTQRTNGRTTQTTNYSGEDDEGNYVEKETKQETFIHGSGTLFNDDINATTEKSESMDEDGVEMTVVDDTFSRSIQFKPTVTFTKNGVSFPFTDFVNDLFKLRKLFDEAREAFKKCDFTIGWNVKCDFSLFTGTLDAKWGNRLKPVCQSDRYTAVDMYYNVDVELVIFAFTLTGEIGIEVDFGIGLVKVALEASISANVELHHVFTNEEDGKEYPPLKSKGTGSISGQAEVNAAGYTLLDVKVEVTIGFEFQGDFVLSWTESPKINGTLKRLPTELEYYAIAATSKAPEPKKLDPPLWEGATIWSGTLFETSNPPT